jgi:hypothetical protein
VVSSLFGFAYAGRTTSQSGISSVSASSGGNTNNPTQNINGAKDPPMTAQVAWDFFARELGMAEGCSAARWG